MLQTPARNGFIDKLTSHIPPALFGRYVLVGIWNTIFGYGTYAGFTALLTPHIPHAYITASIIASLLSITSAFLAYKWLVFKTKGNYVREWMRCIVVYGVSSLIGIALLPVFVLALRYLTGLDAAAPYIGGAVLTGLNVVASFLGHKNFSFASGTRAPSE